MTKWASALDDLKKEQEKPFKMDKICFITSCQRESGLNQRLMSHH